MIKNNYVQFCLIVVELFAMKKIFISMEMIIVTKDRKNSDAFN